jgi:hypothetical protein
MRVGESEIPLARFSALPPTRSATGKIGAMALYAGESVANVDSVRSAAEIVEELCLGAERLLRGARD